MRRFALTIILDYSDIGRACVDVLIANPEAAARFGVSVVRSADKLEIAGNTVTSISDYLNHIALNISQGMSPKK